MTDSDLDKKLNAARTPKLEPDYIEDFPRTVFAKARAAQSAEDSRASHSAETRWWSRAAWSIGFVLFFLIAGFGLGHWRGKMEAPATSANDLLANVKMIHETLALFPNRVRAIVQNGQEVQLVLADQADVPDSPPLFVKICDGKKCSSLVTFSGQEIEIAGQKITILADANGGIILEGKQFVWSSLEKNSTTAGLKIEARHLSPAKL